MRSSNPWTKRKYPGIVRADEDYFTGEAINDQEAPPLTVEEAAAGVAVEGDRRLPKKTAKVASVMTDSDFSPHPVHVGIQKMFGKVLAKKKDQQQPIQKQVSRLSSGNAWDIQEAKGPCCSCTSFYNLGWQRKEKKKSSNRI